MCLDALVARKNSDIGLLIMDNLDFIIRELLKVQAAFNISQIPENKFEKRKLMRSLMNVSHAAPLSEHFLKAQDAELKEQLLEKGIVELTQAICISC